MAGEDDLAQRKKRWRLALGKDAAEEDDRNPSTGFSKDEKKIDQLLEQLYRSDRSGGQGNSKPVSGRWFDQIREVFPTHILHILQKDAIDRFGIKKLLSQASVLESVEPDIELVAAILSVKNALNGPSLDQAKNLIRRLAKAIEEKLKWKMINRLSGRKQSGKRVLNPRRSDVDWPLTIRQNLKHYQPELKTIIPQQFVGRPRKSAALKNLILVVDQSASMTQSMIYAGILAGIMTSINSLSTKFIAFDTSVVDLTEYIEDAVELLFKVQLGGGTNIQQALEYASSIIDPSLENHVVLISDLYEGAPEELLYQQCENLVRASVDLIILLALDDQGKPAYDRQMANRLAGLGIPSFAASPDQFPEIMAAALNYEDLSVFKQ